ncbi:MAG: nitrilase-related carbon-nitrogen hydrolase [Bacteroidales bacterium]|nr:nitrilase-related carbon-nitrogen hydrolase [Bacteroidales bacterium]
MTKTKNNYSYIYLLIGFIFLFFFNGKWILPIAAFIAPVFLIRFFRLQKPLKGFILLVLVGWISNIFIWKGMMPISGFFYYFLMFIFSMTAALTYLIDKAYAKKFKGIISTLVFPSAVILMDFFFVSTSINPSGSYGSLAHTQTFLPLLQIFSVTGIWGMVFIILWTSSMINWLWDNSFEKGKIKLSLLTYGITFISIILFGQIRLAISTKCETVRIASINIGKDVLHNRFNVNVDSLVEKANKNFLTHCEIAATSGAKIVFGTETVISLQKDNENEFIEKAKVIAQKDSIYLGLPMEVILKDFPKVRPENKIIWISPKGQVLYTYHKSKITPGEGDYGNGIIKYFDSPYGRISSSICWDMSHPAYISQVNKMNIDIMLVPGNDWSEITPYHTFVASARAIEQGFNMVRAVSRGFSASFNYKGQLLSSMNYYKTDDLILYSDVPTKGHKTIYSILGDYFAWLCIIFFVIISAFFIKFKFEK